MKKYFVTVRTLIIFLSLLKIISCEIKVGGFLQDSYWTKYDMDLWTFRIHSDNAIWQNDVELYTTYCECVKALAISDNQNIEYLPVKVDQIFPNLVLYQAYSCMVKEIRYENFKRLDKLQYISLSNNELSTLSQNTFKDLKKLKYLFLDGNKFQSIEDDYFLMIRNLQHLNIDRNRISFVSRNAFDYLTELRNLSLSGNNIRSMDDEHFKNNRKIEWIWLNNNKIQLLDATMFDRMNNLHYVDLENNECINDYYYTENLLEMKDKIINKCQ